MHKISDRAKNLKQSAIRAASVQCNAVGGINLGQGVCEIPVPDVIKQGAYNSIGNDKSIYSPCEGILELRQVIFNKIKNFNKIKLDSVDQIMISHGSTGAFVSAVMTLFNPGDEVILFEPFYGYHKNILDLYGVKVKGVSLDPKDFSFDPDDIKKAITPKTRGIVICTPCNPCGKVFSREELLAIGKIAEENNLYILADEIYEYIVYPGFEHVSIASLDHLNERTITLSGFSKTYNMTGWRLGYASGPAEVISKMALVQDLVYVCPPTPLQHAVVSAFLLEPSYYENMAKNYWKKCEDVVKVMQEIGFDFAIPQGAYYILADFSKLGFKDDIEAANIILEKAKVAVVAGRSFYIDPVAGEKQIRLCYALNEDKIQLALDHLQKAFGK